MGEQQLNDQNLLRVVESSIRLGAALRMPLSDGALRQLNADFYEPLTTVDDAKFARVQRIIEMFGRRARRRAVQRNSEFVGIEDIDEAIEHYKHLVQELDPYAWSLCKIEGCVTTPGQ